jgi:hypothetical protein
VHVEGPSVASLGEVEVPVDLAADADGDAEQGVHARVAGREPDGGRVGGDVVHPQRFGVMDEVSEHAQAARKPHLGQDRAFPLGHTGRDELLQILAGLV